jgi:hypothetical protein
VIATGYPRSKLRVEIDEDTPRARVETLPKALVHSSGRPMMASERVEKRRASVPEDPGMDYSNDSDDSSGSRSARCVTAKMLISQIKRGGNNHFGSTGILKCLTCRKRKGKVYPEWAG